MAVLHQFDYILAIGVIFGFLDAFNIGANDVANSFSSSISSRSLKYWQAMVLAAICEFLGAVLAGSRVSDTIKNKIVKLDAFESDPSVLMLTMAVALIGSSVWCSVATYLCMPVSSTHSIIGAVIGAGIAAVGSGNINWGWSGFSQIIASWFIAPVLGGLISSIIFLITKFVVLESDNGLRRAFFFVPVVVFATFSILTMLIVWKGAPNLHLNNLSTGATVGSIFGVGAVACLLYVLILHPFLWRKLVLNDWKLKWYDPFRGFIFWFKSTDDIEPMPEGHQLVVDYYEGKRNLETEANLDEESNLGKEKDETLEQIQKIPTVATSQAGGATTGSASTSIEVPEGQSIPIEFLEKPTADTIRWDTVHFEGEYSVWGKMVWKPSKWGLLLWLIVSHGFRHDVISSQMLDGGALSKNMNDMHKRCKIYDNKVEHLFSLLQCVTACTMSFAHGSNDISNASGPLSTIYLVWTTNSISSKSDIPIWVLCFTAASLVLGIWTFGYRIMAILGNKLTLQSPARGFAIELGAAVTVVMATRLSIPVSTTQIAIGCTVFVGLCNLDLKATNWRIVAFSYLGWCLTLPMAGIISGIIMGVIINAPQWGGSYQLT